MREQTRGVVTGAQRLAHRRLTGFAHEAAGFGDEDVRSASLPLGVVVGEELADVRKSERAGDGVHHAVQQHVSV